MSADPSQYDVDDMFRGSGAPAVKFAKIGTVHGGIITAVDVQQERNFDTDEPEFWDKDKTQPKMMLVVTVQTDTREGDDDDGQRRIFARYGLIQSIKAAVRKAGAKKPEVGGKLLVKYTGDAEPTKRGYNGAKQFSVAYQPPAAAKVEDMFDDEPEAPKPAAKAKAAESDDDLAAALAAFGN